MPLDPSQLLQMGNPMAAIQQNTMVNDPNSGNYASQIMGPMAGIMMGQNALNQQGAQDRAFRGNDLLFADALNTYDQNMKNNPLRDAQRQLGMSQTGVQQEGFDSGDQSKVMKSGLESEIAKNFATKAQAEQQKILEEGRKWQGLNAAMQAYGDNLKDNWDEIRKQAKEDLGQDPGEYNLKHVQLVQAHAAKATATAEFAQKYGLQAAQLGSEEKRTGMQTGASIYNTNMTYQAAMQHFDPVAAQAAQRILGGKGSENDRQIVMSFTNRGMYNPTMASPQVELPGLRLAQAQEELVKALIAAKGDTKDAKVVKAQALVDARKQAVQSGLTTTAPQLGGAASPTGTSAPSDAATTTIPEGWTSMTDDQKKALGYEKVPGGWKRTR